MAYTPTNWSSGDTITSTKLNKIERGISTLDSDKQDKLVFDTTPDTGSTNPVTSEGVYNAIKEVSDSIPTVPKNVRDGEGMESISSCSPLNQASGRYSHAEGGTTVARAWASHAEGSGTIAAGTNQHAAGKFNIEDNTNTYAEIIGIGKNTSSRANGRTLDWSGNEKLAGSLTLGMGTADETVITGAELKLIKPGNVGGLKWNAVGDSVTYVGRYLTVIKNAIGLNPTNCGNSGTCLAINNSYAEKQNVSMVERVLGLNDNPGYSDADVWTINGGVNDVGYGSPIGTFAATGSTFDNTTVYGALQSMVENILGRRNHPRLLLITPHHSRHDGEAMDKIIKAFEDVGAYYGVPVVNLQKTGGINAFNWQHATYPTTSDRLHPNDNGAAMMAAPIIAALKELLYDYIK